MGIREDNQTPDTGGRAGHLKQEGKVSDRFKIKQEMTRQDIKQNVNRDSFYGSVTCVVVLCRSLSHFMVFFYCEFNLTQVYCLSRDTCP